VFFYAPIQAPRQTQYNGGMKIRLFQIDAFADQLFTGNPAAVCPLAKWIPADLMQSIAAENNLAETAFVVGSDDRYEIRWFTPVVEVDLCGHATLAAGFALMNHCDVKSNEVKFHSERSGDLSVKRVGERYILNFPADQTRKCQTPAGLLESLSEDSLPVIDCYRGKTDVMLVLECEEVVGDLKPNFHLLNQVDARGVIVTAASHEFDFVSRFFAPQAGIDEDPVTGSAHTTLMPYWSSRLGKTELIGRQISQRGGTLYCQALGDRVEIGGEAQTYLIGEIEVPG